MFIAHCVTLMILCQLYAVLTIPRKDKYEWSYWRTYWQRSTTEKATSRTTSTTPNPSSEKGIAGVRCGVPRMGNNDPLGLSDANMGVWNSVRTKKPNNVSVALTIVGGRDADIKELCWQAKLHRNGYYICGGSIIGRRTILTATHCVVDLQNPSHPVYKPSSFNIVLGARFSNTDQLGKHPDKKGCADQFNVVRIVSNSRYAHTPNENDIALLTLDRDIDFSKECVCPICIQDTVPSVGEICAVSGYGLESESGTEERNPTPLKAVQIDIMDTRPNNNCPLPEGDDKAKPNLKHFLCAGDVAGQDSCQGDSGGPLFCMDPATNKHYQAGIVSYGAGCGRGIGGVYTRVSSYVEWINVNSGGDMYRPFKQ